MEVFLDNVPSVPSKREIDFDIDLHLSMKPIYIHPYCMDAVEIRNSKIIDLLI